MIALDLNPLLTLFSSIGLEEMGKVRLMNRLDTKYVVSLPVLAEILKCALPDYRIQEIKGQRCHCTIPHILKHRTMPCIWRIITGKKEGRR